ncbi:MAG: hypothetical protein ACE5GS_14265 [Kiloniellaceae bacterium]
MSAARARRGLALALAAAVLAGGLAACGKRASPRPPDGEESRYTYPRSYPDPATVLPRAEPEAAPPSRRAPVHAGGLSPFPTSRTRTTYGEPTDQ